MKKFLSIMLALVMIMNFSVMAFAADFTSVPANDTQDVIVKTTSDTKADKVYKVTVEWDSLTFEYDANNGRTWNPETHIYDGNVAFKNAAGNNAANVVVTNHSNAKVDVKSYFATEGTKTATTKGVTATIGGTDKILARADIVAPGNPDAADKITYNVSLAGNPTDDSQFTVGTVTVALAAAED